MHKWYVLQVMSSQEKRAKKALEENRHVRGMDGVIEDVLLPVENVSEVKNGKRQVVEKRLWPGYLMVRMDMTDDSWSYVKNTNGVIGFLGGENPQPLTDDEMRAILDDLNRKKEKVTQKYQFAIGDKVKIIDGVFINFVGEVAEIFPEKGRLSVSVSIFGRDTRVDDLELWQVEEVTEDSAQ